MKILYLIGGEDVNMRNAQQINRSAIKSAGSLPFLLVFLWTSDIPEKENMYKKILERYFRYIGADKIDCAFYSEPTAKIRQKINNSNVIYLPGGDPRILIEKITNKHLLSDFKQYPKIIIGNSVGALAMCEEYVVIKGQEDYLESSFMPGLGIVDFCVSVHYKSPNPFYGGTHADTELKKLSKKCKIYAIPETSALVYSEGQLKCINDVYLFENQTRTKLRSL